MNYLIQFYNRLFYMQKAESERDEALQRLQSTDSSAEEHTKATQKLQTEIAQEKEKVLKLEV